MRRICLTLPTDRACSPFLHELAEEAVYAVSHFEVEVVLLVLDSSAPADFRDHAQILAGLPPVKRIDVVHLDEDAQEILLRQVIKDADLAEPDRILQLMLPGRRSYGACTNRAFLIAALLGCESVHRRDSDSTFQELDGAKVFPIHHEMAIGTTAAAARGQVLSVDLPTDADDLPVVMAAGSFIGALSVDLDEIRQRDPEIYYEVVSLWARGDAPESEKRTVVAELFVGPEAGPFRNDESVLTIVDPMRVDMSNIAFYQVHEQIPLPPATDQIASDYFLMNFVSAARLPGVMHNRHIVNFHTGERKTDAGFASYQLALTKFFLSKLYIHFIHEQLHLAGGSLRDTRGNADAAVVSAIVRRSLSLSMDENIDRLNRLGQAYRRLGGRYADFADKLTAQRPHLLSEARQDIADFAVLIDVWSSLIKASKSVPHPRRAE